MSRIRPFVEADLDAVVDVFRSNIPKYFGPGEEPGLRSFLAELTDDYYVIELDGSIVGAGGIALNDVTPPTVSLCWGMVRKDHLGTGLGRALTQFRIDLSKDKYGTTPITIGTSQHTIDFYEKFGFRLTERRVDGYGPAIDECRMILEFS